METLQERLINIRGNLSRRAFADLIGTKESTLRNYEKGVTNPDAQFLANICKKLKISPIWLLFGEEGAQEQILNDPIRPEQSDKILEPLLPISGADGTDMINVPLVEARLSAGYGSLQVSNAPACTYSFPANFLLRKGNPQEMVLMYVDGDSMEPEIMDGDMVLIDQSKKEVRLGRVFAVGFEDAIYLKRIDKLPGKILLKSVNPAYPPIRINVGSQEADSFRVIGQVLWVGREY